MTSVFLISALNSSAACFIIPEGSIFLSLVLALFPQESENNAEKHTDLADPENEHPLKKVSP